MKRVVGVLTVMAFLGCGESEKGVRATLAADRQAAERNDWANMCALRTEAGRDGFAFCAQPAGDNETSATLGNEPIVTFLVKQPELTGADVDIDGDRATVHHEGGSVTRLRKVGDRWLIDR
jgi:hypothetical protein